MELSFKDLKKREVINVADGRSLGGIVNLLIDFPEGLLTGIMVRGKKSGGIFGIFNRTEELIDVSKILKIGNDVILVDLKCGDVCAPSTGVGRPKPPHHPPHHPPKKCPPSKPPTCEELFGEGDGYGGRIVDEDDYH